MSPIEIRIELLKVGISQAQIARQCGVSHTQVHRVIYDGIVSDHVRRAIAFAIKRDVKEVWPAYYLKKAVA